MKSLLLFVSGIYLVLIQELGMYLQTMHMSFVCTNDTRMTAATICGAEHNLMS
jgi:hypothetical protein